MSRRHTPLDWLRGLVIVLMMLDHVRSFLAPMGANPTDLGSTTAGFFLIRWVTHLCAPVFVFLMGVSAALRLAVKSEDTPGFLAKRGLWLILLEISWVSFCWSWDWTATYLGVLWALGGSMVLLAMIARLPGRLVAMGGVVLMMLLEWVTIQPEHGFVQLWFQPGAMTILGHRIGGAYALLPWFAVAAVGFGTGSSIAEARPHRLTLTGLVMLGVFVLWRAFIGTDPNPWETQASMLMTIGDFINPSKYPPSLCFVLLTLGIGALLLAGPARRAGRLSRALQIYGRVPMFVYLVHLPLAHLMGNAYAMMTHGTGRVPAGEPVFVPTILAGWLLLTALLYPVCWWWDRIKRRRRDLRWLSYL